MSRGNDKNRPKKAAQPKTEVVTLAGPQIVTESDPLVIAFGQWDATKLPRDVEIEVFEVDAGNDDAFSSSEDVVARFFGTIEPGPDDTARFVADADPELTSPTRSPDRVWIRFAGQGAQEVVAAGIPFSKKINLRKERKEEQNKERVDNGEHPATEGSFYELKVRVKETGTEIAISGRTCVRQKAACLLAVEPLSQNDSSMAHPAGQMILDQFHPGHTKKFGERKWDRTVLRVIDAKAFRLGKSGCSYAVLAMLLLYLRIDKPPAPAPEEGATEVPTSDPTHGTTVTLFEHHIKLAELEAKHADARPRFMKEKDYKFVSDLPGKHHDAERAAFVKHFIGKAKAAGMGGEARSSLRKKLTTFFNSKTRGCGAPIANDPPIVPNEDSSTLYEPASKEIADKDFLPLFVWKLNAIDGRADDMRLNRYRQKEKRLVLSGSGDYHSLGHGEHEQWEPEFEEKVLRDADGDEVQLLLHVEDGIAGKTATGQHTAIILDMTHAMKKAFGLIDHHYEVAKFTEDEPGDPLLIPWQRFVKRTLDRGLPLIGIFSGGQYSVRKEPGHYCVIVGYRWRGNPADPERRKIRFVINDPAGGKTHQYEAHDEEELNPPGKKPTERLRERSRIGMERERKGLNLILERRKLLSLRKLTVVEPAQDGVSTWRRLDHARFLFDPGAPAKAG